MAAPDLPSTLAERGKRYGSFTDFASLCQSIKAKFAYELERRRKILAPDQHEALDMIAHKLARIINGDPDYADSWLDIAGYAQLIANRLAQDGRRALDAACSGTASPTR